MDIYHFSSPKPPILGRCKLLNCNKVAAALAALPTPSSLDGDRLILARIIRDRFGSLEVFGQQAVKYRWLKEVS